MVKQPSEKSGFAARVCVRHYRIGTEWPLRHLDRLCKLWNRRGVRSWSLANRYFSKTRGNCSGPNPDVLMCCGAWQDLKFEERGEGAAGAADSTARRTAVPEDNSTTASGTCGLLWLRICLTSSCAWFMLHVARDRGADVSMKQLVRDRPILAALLVLPACIHFFERRTASGWETVPQGLSAGLSVLIAVALVLLFRAGSMVMPMSTARRPGAVLLCCGGLIASIGCSRSEDSGSAQRPNARPERPAQRQPNQALLGHDATAFTIATLNVNWGNVNLPAIVSAIREADADLVALQETNEESQAWLQDELAPRYPDMLFHDPQEFPAGGFGFLSKAPVIRHTYVPREHGLFGTWIAEVELGGRVVPVVNVHLQPPVFRREATPLDLLGALGEAEAVRAREIDKIVAQLPPDRPAIILGDFNSLSTFAAPRHLIETGYVDSFASVHTDPDRHATWRWPMRFGTASFRIDYIFHAPALETQESRIVSTAGADHDLLVSRLRWRTDDR